MTTSPYADLLLSLREDDPPTYATMTRAAAIIEELNSSLELSIKSWHKTETDLAKVRDALMQILRMPVSAQAKTIAREALAHSQG